MLLAIGKQIRQGKLGGYEVELTSDGERIGMYMCDDCVPYLTVYKYTPEDQFCYPLSLDQLEIKKCRGKLETFELIGANPDSVCKKAQDFWPNVTYKGWNICDALIEAHSNMQDALGFDDDKTNGQLAYLGYVPSKDIFISAWDMGTEKISNTTGIVTLKFKNNEFKVTKATSGEVGMVYASGGGLSSINNTYPDIVDLKHS